MIFEETHTLSNGVKIPKLGLGTWSIPDDTAANMRLGNGKAFLIKIISKHPLHLLSPQPERPAVRE